MDILEKIVEHKKQEVAQRKELYPVKLLEQSIYFNTQPVSLSKYLRRSDKNGIIAEFKRKSPSKGNINTHANVETVSIGYMQAGASALSVLTDQKFFGGKNTDLTEARKFNFCPILRKEFIVDEYQIVEAKSIGADAILLIAECLEKKKIANLAEFARSLQLEVLMEIHDAVQLEKCNPHLNVVGVNNRNLKTFKVDTQTSLDLLPLIPNDFVKISESGISNPQTIVDLSSAGFDGFLIGEHFMNNANPHFACRDFIIEVERLKKNLVAQ